MRRGSNGRYSKEFREEAVKMVVEGGLSAYEASSRLSLPKSTLENWVKLFKAGKLKNIGKHQRPLTEVEQELAKVKRELSQVKQERDILKNFLDNDLSPVRAETSSVCYTHNTCREERPSAFWCSEYPLKNMAHGVLRT